MVMTIGRVIALLVAIGGGQVATGETKSGTLMLIGGVLNYNERAVWQRMFELAGGEDVDVVVIAAANPRAKIYGGYAVRALSRYGPFVELLPLAVEPEQFSTSFQRIVQDPEIIEQVRQARIIFFVGGQPQRLAKVLFNDDGTGTPLAAAVREVYTGGGVIVGGIPGAGGAHTGLDAREVLRNGHLAEQDRYRGLGLIDNAWLVDQSFFSAGRFAETLVGMRQLKLHYGLGIGANAAAIIKNDQLEVIGDGGLVLIDLSIATSTLNKTGFGLSGARLTYIDQGDRLALDARQILPHADKLDGFEIDPNADDHQPLLEKHPPDTDVFAPGNLVQLMLTALDSEARQSIGLANRGGSHDFQFRFYTGSDTRGWLALRSGSERYSMSNIYLDIKAAAPVK